MTAVTTDLKEFNKLLALFERTLRVHTPRRPPPPPGMRWVTAAEAQRLAKIREEKKAAAEQARIEDADAELRLDVIEALTAKGIAQHVAANLTNTTPKLLEQAKLHNLI